MACYVVSPFVVIELAVRVPHVLCSSGTLQQKLALTHMVYGDLSHRACCNTLEEQAYDSFRFYSCLQQCNSNMDPEYTLLPWPYPA